MPDQFEKLQKHIGDKAKLINIPMIKIEPVEATQELLEEIRIAYGYNWIIFRSMRGVQHFFTLYDKTSEERSRLNQVKFACIGDSTKNELQKYGFDTDYLNPGITSKDFAKHLLNDVLKESDTILMPIGSRSSMKFPEQLAETCTVSCMYVYETVGITRIDWEILKILDKGAYDLLVFTSPSAFQNYIGITGSHPGVNDLKIAAIGATTNEAIEEEGFKSALIASKPDLEVFANEILEYLNQDKR